MKSYLSFLTILLVLSCCNADSKDKELNLINEVSVRMIDEALNAGDEKRLTALVSKSYLNYDTTLVNYVLNNVKNVKANCVLKYLKRKDYFKYISSNENCINKWFYLLEAFDLFNEQNFESALEKINYSLNLDSLNSSAIHLRALIADYSGNCNNALHLYEKLPDEYKRGNDVKNDIAYALSNCGYYFRSNDYIYIDSDSYYSKIELIKLKADNYSALRKYDSAKHYSIKCFDENEEDLFCKKILFESAVYSQDFSLIKKYNFNSNLDSVLYLYSFFTYILTEDKRECNELLVAHKEIISEIEYKVFKLFIKSIFDNTDECSKLQSLIHESKDNKIFSGLMAITHNFSETIVQNNSVQNTEFNLKYYKNSICDYISLVNVLRDYIRN